MAESTTIDLWLNTALSGDASLAAVVGTRIYSDLAPDGAALPMVVYQMQAANDLMTNGAARVWANTLFLVRGVAQRVSYDGDLITMANRIDAVLHGASGSNAEGNVWECVRERPFRLTEVGADGKQYRHLGGLYRILAK
jgi:hypothetical protein